MKENRSFSIPNVSRVMLDIHTCGSHSIMGTIIANSMNSDNTFNGFKDVDVTINIKNLMEDVDFMKDAQEARKWCKSLTIEIAF